MVAKDKKKNEKKKEREENRTKQPASAIEKQWETSHGSIEHSSSVPVSDLL